MKNSKSFLVFFIISLLFFSCSVSKRHYLPGYSVEWRTISKNAESDRYKTHNSAQSSIVNYQDCNCFDTSTSKLSNNDFPLIASADGFTCSKKTSVLGKNVKNQKYFTVLDCDVITLKNGNEIYGKVAEISSTEIKYKRCDNIEGPTIIINKSDVAKIKYTNGTTELINAPSTAEEQDYYSPSAKHKKPANNNNLHNNLYHQKLNPFAIAGMISAILSVIYIPLALAYSPFLLILAPVPIYLGIVALKEIKANPEIYRGKGMARFGIIFGAVLTSIVLYGLLLYLLLFLLA